MSLSTKEDAQQGVKPNEGKVKSGRKFTDSRSYPKNFPPWHDGFINGPSNVPYWNNFQSTPRSSEWLDDYNTNNAYPYNHRPHMYRAFTNWYPSWNEHCADANEDQMIGSRRYGINEWNVSSDPQNLKRTVSYSTPHADRCAPDTDAVTHKTSKTSGNAKCLIDWSLYSILDALLSNENGSMKPRMLFREACVDPVNFNELMVNYPQVLRLNLGPKTSNRDGNRIGHKQALIQLNPVLKFCSHYLGKNGCQKKYCRGLHLCSRTAVQDLCEKFNCGFEHDVLSKRNSRVVREALNISDLKTIPWATLREFVSFCWRQSHGEVVNDRVSEDEVITTQSTSHVSESEKSTAVSQPASDDGGSQAAGSEKLCNDDEELCSIPPETENLSDASAGDDRITNDDLAPEPVEPKRIQWQILSPKGVWINLCAEQGEGLEAAFVHPDMNDVPLRMLWMTSTCVDQELVELLGCDVWKADFNSMTLTFLDTQKTGPSFELRRLSPCENKRMKWYFEVDNRWIEFKSDEASLLHDDDGMIGSDDIEEHIRGQLLKLSRATVEISADSFKGVKPLKFGKLEDREIDFSTMLEIKLTDGTSRKIRRRPKPIPDPDS